MTRFLAIGLVCVLAVCLALIPTANADCYHATPYVKTHVATVVAPVAVPVVVPAAVFQYLPAFAPPPIAVPVAAAPIYAAPAPPPPAAFAVPACAPVLPACVPVGTPLVPAAPAMPAAPAAPAAVPMQPQATAPQQGLPVAREPNDGQQQQQVANAHALAAKAYGILNMKCATCHTGGSAKGGLPMFVANGQPALLSDAQWARIVARSKEATMPPAAGGDTNSPLALTSEEIESLQSAAFLQASAKR